MWQNLKNLFVVSLICTLFLVLITILIAIFAPNCIQQEEQTVIYHLRFTNVIIPTKEEVCTKWSYKDWRFLR